MPEASRTKSDHRFSGNFVGSTGLLRTSVGSLLKEGESFFRRCSTWILRFS